MAERKAPQNKQILDAIEKLDNKLNLVLYGDASTNTPGIMERLRKLEDWVNSEKKLIYLIVGIIITDIVTRVLALLAK